MFEAVPWPSLTGGNLCDPPLGDPRRPTPRCWIPSRSKALRTGPDAALVAKFLSGVALPTGRRGPVRLHAAVQHARIVPPVRPGCDTRPGSGSTMCRWSEPAARSVLRIGVAPISSLRAGDARQTNEGVTMALEMKTVCERCAEPLQPDGEAWICSYECSFCSPCTAAMNAVCPNCGGELVRRPRRTPARVSDD